MKWTRVEDASGDVIDGISFRKDTIPSGDDARPAFAFLLSPEAVKDTSAPVIVTPHGGPHGTIVECFMRNAALYVRLGFKLLLVDYRGSTGVDDDYVRSLLGEVGNLDVKDTVAAIHYYAGLNLIDRSKIILNGGSHGGFIVTHLAGQYPELNFVVCIARNPIIDYSTMTELTDEVDWVWNCTVKGQKWTYNANPNGEQLKQMYEKSPIAFVDKVRTPTLMMLGSRDRRVPMSQGIKWYNTLRANGVETRCHVYEDSHGLGQVKVDGDVFMNSMLWILSHLNQ
ncbi:Acylamino-acid-releasing enzyme [Halotydeus destructor]|nr:Acylamino-acid-releasing enzyme [Halotydeus destructor]